MVGGNVRIREAPETGVDAICRQTLGGDFLDSAGADYLDMSGLGDALRTVLGDEAAADLMALPPPGE